MIGKLVLFGATGDLAGRYLMPALARLLAAGRLPGGFEVFGAAKEQWGEEAFRRHALGRLERHASDLAVDTREAFARTLHYQPVDFGEPSGVAGLVREAAGVGGAPVAAYLALPPGAYFPAVAALGAAGLPAGSRIAVEKPYGEDLEGTVALNRQLVGIFGEAAERAVFRVDHVLGLATAQNLLGMRFANPILEHVWNGAHVEQVEVLWEETLALEGRASFYDSAGALKDVLQNHMLQVLCVVAMEPPASFGERDLRDGRLAVLRSIPALSASEAAARTQRARYTAGRIGDREVPSYVDEKGVDPARATETFVEAVLDVEMPRWAGTRFVFRAGKALARTRMEAVLHFRPAQGAPFGGGAKGPVAGELRIGIAEPDDIVLRLVGSEAGSPPAPALVTLVGAPPESEFETYGRILLEILSGGSTMSVSEEEAEEEWRVVTPIIRAWAEGRVPMGEYPAGSEGPGYPTGWPG